MSEDSMRKYFPAFNQSATAHSAIYFDSAATSHKPEQVLTRVDSFYRFENANVHRASHTTATAATTAFEQARGKVARFINAASEKEIVWTKGATEAINLVASGLSQFDWPQNKHILISACEHHANIVPWQQLAKASGLCIKVMPIDDSGVLQLSEALQMIRQDTAILAIGHVSNALGNIHPIAPILAKAREVGAITLVDGTQAVPHLQVDMQRLGCDFYVFSGHKMFAPTGTGVLYGRYQQLEALPVYQCGGEMIQKVSFEHSRFQPPPLKFETGTPNISGILGLSAAVDFILQHRQQIANIEQQLYRQLIQGLMSVEGIKLWGELENSISSQSFTVNGLDNQDLGMMLNEQGFAVRVGHHCAMPLMAELGIHGTVRASLACYNTAEEVTAFIQALKNAISMLSINSSSNSNSNSRTPTESTQTNIKTPIENGVANDNKTPIESRVAKNSETLTKSAEWDCAKPAVISAPLADKVREAKGWDGIYRQIMLAGKAVKSLPDEARTPDNEVYGCESQLWLEIQCTEQRVSLAFYSPSKIVRGLLALLMEPLNNQSAAWIRDFDLQDYFRQLGLDKHLSQSRGNGLNTVMEKIKQAVENSESPSGNKCVQ